MTDAAASLPTSQQQQPNGKSAPFSLCRDADSGADRRGRPILMSPSSNQEVLEGEGMVCRWQPREAKLQDGSPVSGEDTCPGMDCAASVAERSEGLSTPEGVASMTVGHNCGEAGDIQKASDQDQPELQGQEYCGPLGQTCSSQVGEEERQLGKRKHRHRRLPSKKKKIWKPYYQLSWEEKKKFDEKQSQRASRVRAEMFAKGQPVAPYNTTQFLMEDHDQEEPDLKTGLNPKKSVAKSDDTSEEDFVEEDGGSDGMGRDGSEFLQKDFSETYERYHVESLQNMSKQELIGEYLELEKCLSRMEEENNHLRMENKKLLGDLAENPRVSELEQELDRLRAENQKLLKENELSRQQEKTLSKPGE